MFTPAGSLVGRLTLPVFRPEWSQYGGPGGPRGRESVEWEVTIPDASHELLDMGAGRLAVLRRAEEGEEWFLAVSSGEVNLVSCPANKLT